MATPDSAASAGPTCTPGLIPGSSPVPSSDPAAGHRAPHLLPVEILPQPDDTTCGPTCLHAVYRHWGDDVSLPEVIATAATLGPREAGRGTLAVMLGVHALSRGYRATITTFNLPMFDPTWFGEDGRTSSSFLADRLRQQSAARCPDDPAFREATDWYLRFLAAGGDIRLEDLGGRFIIRHLRAGRPILTGLSSTWLYRAPREFGPDDDEDDIRGAPTGHFVVLHGYDPATRRVTVADPLADNPGFASQRYTVNFSRLIAAIMLGVLTDDANLLVIRPGESAAAPAPAPASGPSA